MIELVMVIVISAVVVLSVGFVMSDNHRAWNDLYKLVFDETKEQGYLAGKVFETITRKSSKETHLIEQQGTSCTLYYYDNLDAEAPDRYAKFYVLDRTLYVQRGSSNEVFSNIRLADNVQNIQFSTNGDAVKMKLVLSRDDENMQFVHSAVRHAQ